MRTILITAFLEGLTVLIIEIAGARALAPFFGTSLNVWTATITSTLLFLALGYGLGARLSQQGPMALPTVFWTAGGWLCVYPFWRTSVLQACSALGISTGAFAASSWLFGVPLCCLGAVSPLLIHRLGQIGIDPGRASGWLFFTNTLGGLAGGWLTALVLIPIAPLRIALAGAGAVLVAIGGYWAHTVGKATPVLPMLIAAAALTGLAPKPRTTVASSDPNALPAKIVYREQSPTGLVQVLETPGYGSSLFLDGVLQGGMDEATGASLYNFSEYMSFLAYRYHPHAKNVLLLGLGCGVLAKTFHRMGLEVTAIEIEPEVVRAAREHFGLPPQVRIVEEDARTYIARTSERFDIVVLDAFAGENSPWYLFTREGLSAIKSRLRPGGRMVVNAVTQANGETEGLKRIEAGLMAAFGEARVYVEPRLPNEAEEIVNATLVAGTNLVPHDLPYPVQAARHVEAFLGDLRAVEPRPARKGGRIDVDDQSSLDRVEADVRLRWRKSVIALLGPEVLQD